MNINEKIAFANRWHKLTKEQRKIVPFLLNRENHEFVGSKQDLALVLGYGVENSQFNKRVKHLEDLGMVTVSKTETRSFSFRLNDNWEDVLMTNSEFESVEKPTKSPRKDPNLNVKEYFHNVYMRKKEAKSKDSK